MLCKLGDAPVCIEEDTNQYILNWDMAQPLYVQTLPDSSGNGHDLQLTLDPLLDPY